MIYRVHAEELICDEIPFACVCDLGLGGSLFNVRLGLNRLRLYRLGLNVFGLDG